MPPPIDYYFMHFLDFLDFLDFRELPHKSVPQIILFIINFIIIIIFNFKHLYFKASHNHFIRHHFLYIIVIIPYY
jgi:hypothetical protein